MRRKSCMKWYGPASEPHLNSPFGGHSPWQWYGFCETVEVEGRICMFDATIQQPFIIKA